MLLETIHLDINPEIFDIHFREFIRKWNVLILERQKVGNVRIRYGVYYQERETTENKNLLAEVEVTSVNKDKIEVRIALVELDRVYSYDFIPALGNFIDSKWHDDLILDDFNNWDLRKGLRYLKQTLMERYGFKNLDDLSSPIKLPEGTDEKRAALVAFMHEHLRLSLVEKLQERLPPIDPLPGDTSKKKTTGRPGLSEEKLFYRLSKAQEAKEIKAANSKMTWRDIVEIIKWNVSKIDESNLKLLEDARYKLRRLEISDPNGILKKLEEWKKTKKT
jgi:hypothetical protein